MLQGCLAARRADRRWRREAIRHGQRRPGFDRKLIDCGSDFFNELLGPQNGRHAHSALGLAKLPHEIAVEINGEFEITQ